MIGDYFYNIDILTLSKVRNGTGFISNWVKVGTLRGLINKKMPNVGTLGGKVNEVSEYKAMGFYHPEVKPENRLSYGGYTYRIKGKPKDCIGLGHHITVELDFVGQDNNS